MENELETMDFDKSPKGMTPAQEKELAEEVRAQLEQIEKHKQGISDGRKLRVFLPLSSHQSTPSFSPCSNAHGQGWTWLLSYWDVERNAPWVRVGITKQKGV